jgi:hypothetical protein
MTKKPIEYKAFDFIDSFSKSKFVRTGFLFILMWVMLTFYLSFLLMITQQQIPLYILFVKDLLVGVAIVVLAKEMGKMKDEIDKRGD